MFVIVFAIVFILVIVFLALSLVLSGGLVAVRMMRSAPWPPWRNAGVSRLQRIFLQKSLCACAAQGWEVRGLGNWQRAIEKKTFSRLSLTPSRLADFGNMIHRNRALVRYVWLCIELREYGCMSCIEDETEDDQPGHRRGASEYQQAYGSDHREHGRIILEGDEEGTPGGEKAKERKIAALPWHKRWHKKVTDMIMYGPATRVLFNAVWRVRRVVAKVRQFSLRPSSKQPMISA
ncbi:hypothetical protein QBC46DRAFT_449128 [Diplogelasinospora grovesii]|uniref:Uncharacterized protein n=1 Tax=Diplogelasinospora grovesii TaxID=303347 RepID=A0AAN6N844_9PEZI|nr:hypothetical protein QBC46DRAFT_449128 [Diplogelasinospora grovesii]